MKIIGRESLTAAVFATAFSQTMAEPCTPVREFSESDRVEQNHISVKTLSFVEVIRFAIGIRRISHSHCSYFSFSCVSNCRTGDALIAMGATKFADALEDRAVDFKYGQFTIFAPSDKLFQAETLILEDLGYTASTMDDIALFHVSADGMTEKVLHKKHCGESLLMLNEELEIDQESSVTACDHGKVYQVGPGNVDILPEVVGEPVLACDSVIYCIEGSVMLPTLPNVAEAPVPAPTRKPTRQDSPTDAPVEPEPEPVEPPTSAGAIPSVALAALATLVVSLL
jgi:hypothetical protein